MIAKTYAKSAHCCKRGKGVSFDDSLNKDICVEVFPFRQAARIDGNNGLTMLVGSDEFDKLPSFEFLSDGILVGLK